MAAAPQVGGYGTAGTAPYIYPRFLSAVEEYHPARDAWVTRPDSRSARYYLSAVGTAQGDVYAVGGYGVAATGAAATVGSTAGIGSGVCLRSDLGNELTARSSSSVVGGVAPRRRLC